MGCVSVNDGFIQLRCNRIVSMKIFKNRTKKFPNSDKTDFRIFACLWLSFLCFLLLLLLLLLLSSLVFQIPILSPFDEASTCEDMDKGLMFGVMNKGFNQ